jgi:hypothetical protein
VSFLRPPDGTSEEDGLEFQSPGGDWCHFYIKEVRNEQEMDNRSFSPLAGIGVISTVWPGWAFGHPIWGFQSPGGDWCHFYWQCADGGDPDLLREGFSPLAGIGVISTRGVSAPLTSSTWSSTGFSPLAGIGVISTSRTTRPSRSTEVSVPWRGLVSFLRDGTIARARIVCDDTFQSPGGDWCHFYATLPSSSFGSPCPRFQSPGGDWCHFYRRH